MGDILMGVMLLLSGSVVSKVSVMSLLRDTAANKGRLASDKEDLGHLTPDP